MEKVCKQDKQLNYLFVINTEGQVHTWKNLMRALANKGNSVSIIARDYGDTLNLLQKEGFEHKSFKPVKNKRFKVLDIFKHIVFGLKARFSLKPDLTFGFGVDASVLAKFSGSNSIIFTDNEPIGVQNKIIKLLSSCIITPEKFGVNLGKKHLRIPSYKELAYLNPNQFSPNPSIKSEMGLSGNEKYAILRFNAFDAVHDINRKGFSLKDKYKLVKKIKLFARVFISSESEVPNDLKKFKLPVATHKIHDALYYAELIIADTGTMAWEASILGTPSVVCLSNHKKFSNFTELEQRYDLMYSFSDSSKAIEKAVELIQQPGLKVEWKKKREKLLEDKIDFTAFMVDFIERWPESFNELKGGQVSK